jgi:hypothetical protein
MKTTAMKLSNKDRTVTTEMFKGWQTVIIGKKVLTSGMHFYCFHVDNWARNGMMIAVVREQDWQEYTLNRRYPGTKYLYKTMIYLLKKVEEQLALLTIRLRV